VIGTLVSTAMFTECQGFDPETPIYEDWQLWLRCERNGARLVEVPEAVYVAPAQPRGRNKGAGPGFRDAWYWRIRGLEEEARAR